MMAESEGKPACVAEAHMDELDRRLLDIIQASFPIAPRPYEVLGEMLGISEAEAFQRVEAMRANGIIRRLGANFQSAKIGFVSTLCAAKVPQAQIPSFVEKVNAIPGVTHNYEREHIYNIWFTLISQSREAANQILRDLETDTGIEILNLPATKFYKIRVDFPMASGEQP